MVCIICESLVIQMDLLKIDKIKRQKVTDPALTNENQDVMLAPSENSNEIIIDTCEDDSSTDSYKVMKIEENTRINLENKFRKGNIMEVKAEQPNLNVYHMYTAMDVSDNDVRTKEEQRRLSHNEIERRRRDKINGWINRLNLLIPSNLEVFDKDTLTVYDSQSKGGILAKACEYILQLQDHVRKLTDENDDLRKRNHDLCVGNEHLKHLDRASVITASQNSSSIDDNNDPI